MVASCRTGGGCPSDYLAASFAALVCALIALGTLFMLWHRHFVPIKAKQVSLMALQSVGSLIWVFSIVFAQGLFQFKAGTIWENCSLWKMWIGSLLGFGLWLSCHIARTYRLYYVFVGRRLPPLHPVVVVALLLIPWLVFCLGGYADMLPVSQLLCRGHSATWALLSAVTQLGDLITSGDKKHCEFHIAWSILNLLMISTYLLLLYWGVRSIRKIHFYFNEERELKLLGQIVLVFLGVWFLFWGIEHATSHYGNVGIVKRFVLLIGVSVTALLFFYLPMLGPFRTLLKGGPYDPCGGHPPSDDRDLPPGEVQNASLETLLGYPLFMDAFIAFAESRYAGESVRFCDAVQKRSMLPKDAFTSRVYAAERIIGQFVEHGSPMEVNISSAMRTKILRAADLASEDLFKEARAECLRMFCQNFEKDFRQSEAFHAAVQELEDRQKFARMGVVSTTHNNKDGIKKGSLMDLEKGHRPEPARASSLPIARASLEDSAGEMPLLGFQEPIVPHSFTEGYTNQGRIDALKQWEDTPGVVVGGEFDTQGVSAKVKNKKKAEVVGGESRSGTPSGVELEEAKAVEGGGSTPRSKG